MTETDERLAEDFLFSEGGCAAYVCVFMQTSALSLFLLLFIILFDTVLLDID